MSFEAQNELVVLKEQVEALRRLVSAWRTEAIAIAVEGPEQTSRATAELVLEGRVRRRLEQQELFP